MNNRNSKKSNSVGNISSDSTAKVKRFKSVFINSNLSIVEILKNHENLALLEDFIALNDSWNEKTKITETIFLTYKSQLLNLYSRMDDQPKYKSKYKSYKNYGKIILGGRGG